MSADLSVVIPSQNSAATLAGTLASVAFADEVIVLDAGSTDGTIELAERAGARVIRRPYANDGDQRNAGWQAAVGRWVLALDSDEWLDADSTAAIRRVVARDPSPGEPVAYELLWRNYFLGHPLKHGGLDRDYHVRLGFRTRTRWEPVLHAPMLAEGPVGRLTGLVHHPSCTSLASRFEKIGRYAADRAGRWRAEGVKTSLPRAAWDTLRYFCGRALLRGGYRDGLPGLVWWWLMATELLLSHFLLAFPAGREAAGANRRVQPPSH